MYKVIKMRKLAIISIILLFAVCYSGCVKEEVKKIGKMKIYSPAFNNNGYIPKKYTCDGIDISPPLNFSGIPNGTVSLALVMKDPDAPHGTFIHWLIWNIPPDATGFLEGENIPYPEGRNGFNIIGYGGPCPPKGSTHHYFFILYALDTTIDLNEGANVEELEKAMSGHIIEEAELVGLYGR